MPADMLMDNPSSVNRKRPLTDATMGMNTPKREYYQDFNPYQYMNMVMNPQPMFQSTPFAMRTDENQPPFMTGEFCSPVTLAELKRRIAAPECLNSSFLGIYLRLAKTKEVGKELRDNLAKHGISLPSGRRKGIQNTVFTCLVEEEATQLGRDMHTLVQQHYPIRQLIDMAARKTISHPEERRRDLIGTIRILDELSTMFNELQTPLVSRIQNNVPIHNELEVGMNHFSLRSFGPTTFFQITHTFGPINQSTWCNAFLNYAKMSLSMYQNRGMEQVNRQVSRIL
uniref:TF_AP-2 domain-containing protein n=1 Tax=Angiostrongylus cantonensis TaxID=6313 RepID=A0A0K0CSV9_ANGCA